MDREDHLPLLWSLQIGGESNHLQWIKECYKCSVKFLPLTLSYETCLILGTPRNSPCFIRDISYCPACSIHYRRLPYNTEGLPYTPGDCPTIPTAYPASGRAYPLVPCVPSKLTQATGRTQPANKEGPCVQGTQQGISANQLISKYSEYRGPYVVSANKGQWQRLIHLPLWELGDRRSPSQTLLLLHDTIFKRKIGRTVVGGNMRRVWLKEFRKSERISWLKERQSQTL